MAEMAEERQYEEIEAPQQTSEAAETVQEVQSDDDGTMSLIAHLTELRSRLIKCLIAVGLGSCVGYYFIEEIMHYLTLPAGKLYYMQPSEAFFTYLKVAVVAGFLMALPIVFYQVWRFFLPACKKTEIDRRSAKSLTFREAIPNNFSYTYYFHGFIV